MSQQPTNDCRRRWIKCNLRLGSRVGYIAIILFCVIVGVAYGQQENQSQNSPRPQTDQPKARRVKRVKRARRPKFDESKIGKTFFKDVYSQAIVGERPSSTSLKKGNTEKSSLADSSQPSSASNGWQKLVDAAAIEDEVKSLQQNLSQLITTPVIFQTKFNEVNQSYDQLSMLFAIIRQYDGDVRWTKHASAAQLLFQKAAVASRKGDLKGFQYCKSRKQDLEELVRGGSIQTNDPIPDAIDWSVAASRTAIMIRLETANQRLKRLTADPKSFQSGISDLYHESNLIAAMGRVILESGMPEFDEDGYVEYGNQMQEAAAALKSAIKANDFDAASTAGNQVSKSCVDCHGDWR